MSHRLLIDADVLVYRVGYKTNDEPVGHAKHTMDILIGTILGKYPETPYQLYLSGPSKDNYRHDYAVTAPYKGNRSKEKPVHYQALRDYLVDEHDAVMTDGNEADDQIAIDYTALWDAYCADMCSDGFPVVVSVDKDFDQLTGMRYDFVKQEEVWKERDEAVRNLWTQVLVGDRVDNIKGIHGVGPVKAEKILADCTVPRAYFNTCIAAFIEKEGIPDEEAQARVVENMRLVYLQRSTNDLWSPETHLD